MCSVIFTVLGVPFLREGYLFALPTITIEVAKECSGIHSTIALFIVSLVAGHLFLPAVWKKVLLVATALPVVCITNGVRIAGLTLLSVYVDPRFMHSSLHRDGGVAFFMLGLILLFGVLRLLQRGQKAMNVRTND
jgi:exosortase